jgi:hypothetical protein
VIARLAATWEAFTHPGLSDIAHAWAVLVWVCLAWAVVDAASRAVRAAWSSVGGGER